MRELFVEVLDFDAEFGHVDLGATPGSMALPASAERVAYLGGVQVVYLTLEAPESDRVGKGEAATAARLINQQLDGDLLLVVTNSSASQLHLVYPSFEHVRPVLRRMVVERDLPRRTAIQQVSNIYWKHRDTGSIRKALDEAFDVEPVTREFFQEYKRAFSMVYQSVTGFGEDVESKRRFVQTLFNRLMFIYFLSRKGWLTFKGDREYLNALWRDYRNKDGDNFYEERLWPLFFHGLNKPRPNEMGNAGAYLSEIIGHVPFLNGGLFERNELDIRDGIVVQDECITEILTKLFDRFNFTVLESTPFDVEVAVDPEMLGKMFEELVTGRHDSGAYYTPRTVVSFMCREALKGYLEREDTGLTPEAIGLFVDSHVTEGVQVAQARRVAEALADVTVVDPACGSGAYLLGMMQELIELQTALYNAGVDAKALYDLKLEIIQRNLYGVDIDDFAVNIAMLRMWLSLAIEYEGEHPEPLPNLDFKVLCGDSLLGPDPSPEVEVQGTLGYDADAVRRLGRLKAEYMRASEGPDKQRLFHAIHETETALRSSLDASGVPLGAIDWRVEFAEVFAQRRGFDIAIANPPYVQLQANQGLLANQYKHVGYGTLARTGDVYQLFYERGCQVLKPANGLLAYVTSNSWLKAEYGKTTRRYLAGGHTPLRLLELGKDVFESAIVDSSVLMLRTGGSGREFLGVDMERLADNTVPPEERHWGLVRPDGDSPWSILSPLEQCVLDKMRAIGTPLKEWDNAIYRGITTGLNDAFIIDNETKDALIAEDPKSADVIKPVLRGRDIQRYQAQWRGLWLIATFPALDLNIDNYPAVKRHLLSFGKRRLEQSGKRLPNGERSRKKTSNAWFEMQDTCAYHEDFRSEKLFWMDMTARGRFSYSNDEMYCNDKGFMMTGESLKYLCAVLNSTLIAWLMKTAALTTGMGLPQWKKFAVERIPIPSLTPTKQRVFIEMTDHILRVKAEDKASDTSQTEAEIDKRVYQLYGLTPQEISEVEERL